MGEIKKNDARVLKLVDIYTGHRFCPLVIFSNGSKPEALQEGPFLRWADKSKRIDIENAIGAILDTGIPQMARQLHDELDGVAGTYLWEFLETQWGELNQPHPLDPEVLERMIRRRAAIQIGDIDPESGMGRVSERAGAEYYIYPAMKQEFFSLGDIVRHKEDNNDLRVILTPHCHLFVQPGKEKPGAEQVLTVKVFEAGVTLGDKLEHAKGKEPPAQKKKLSAWAQSPSKTKCPPEGRHWFLPEFLEIPHAFCDFLRVETLPHDDLWEEYDRIATLAPPYAEALQSCFAGFYSSVGIPLVKPESIESLLQ
jgi:hypothetical protein